MGKEGRRQQITTVVAYAITGAWSVSFVIDILVPSYDPPPTLTPLMLIVAGWCFSDGLMPPKRRGPTSEETDS